MSISERYKPKFSPNIYTVGWISTLPTEYEAAIHLLDENHREPEYLNAKNISCTLGRIHNHNVVIACPPVARLGLISAASMVEDLTEEFPNVKFSLMVGVGRGVPTSKDVRLGDVIISQPNNGLGGLLQYEMKGSPNIALKQIHHMDSPPEALLNAMEEVQARQARGEGQFTSYLSHLEENILECRRPDSSTDCLFQPTSPHAGGTDCRKCDQDAVIQKKSRPADDLVHIHYGTVASGNYELRSAIERDRTAQLLGEGILCFETEAAGLMSGFPCVLIRGISDYADSHKNEAWQSYAAATAAAYAKELLSVTPCVEIEGISSQAPPFFSNVPYLPDLHFVERVEITTWLYENCSEPGCRAALVGIGGIG